MDFKYRKFKTTDKKVVAGLMKELFKETSNETVSNKNISKTFSELLHYPEKGIILVLENKKQIVGYCLLINFWSNEFGGNILYIDEIYIKPLFCEKNIGTNFIKSLIKNKLMKAVTFQLEVKPSNRKVIKMYKKIGFKLSRNSHLIYTGSKSGI